MPELTEYGEVMINAYLDEFGRHRIDGLLEDGTKIIIAIGIILKQWSQICYVSHIFKRPYRSFKITQTLNLTHIFCRPFRTLKMSQILQISHVFRRPSRFLKLTQNIQLIHYSYVNKLIKYLTQFLNPLHSWIKQALGGFPFKISVEEQKPILIEVEEQKMIQIEVEER